LTGALIGAGLLTTASSLGIFYSSDKKIEEAKQNTPQVVRVFELKRDLSELTDGLSGIEALEKYVGDVHFRESCTSLINEYNSLIENKDIVNAYSAIKKNNPLSGFCGLFFGLGLSTIILAIYTHYTRGARKKSQLESAINEPR